MTSELGGFLTLLGQTGSTGRGNRALLRINCEVLCRVDHPTSQHRRSDWIASRIAAGSLAQFLGLSGALTMSQDDISYSDTYADEHYTYRHVILPPSMAKSVPKNHLMTETEWRNLGVQQSVGWVHYMMHAPEPHVLVFRKPKPVKAVEGDRPRAQ